MFLYKLNSRDLVLFSRRFSRQKLRMRICIIFVIKMLEFRFCSSQIKTNYIGKWWTTGLVHVHRVFAIARTLKWAWLVLWLGQWKVQSPCFICSLTCYYDDHHRFILFKLILAGQFIYPISLPLRVVSSRLLVWLLIWLLPS